ncbi:MAG: hypothetical protein HC923_04205 [Myxococcales bacterium]|nr:hypothetical protein [Myxococcales bacterium]
MSSKTSRPPSAAMGALPVATVGYCYGGSLSFLAASRLPVRCSVAYYGGQIPRWMDEMTPAAPVQLHFAENDRFIAPGDIEKVRRAFGERDFYTYDAGHGFNCEDRDDFDPVAARLALVRTLRFLDRALLGAA